MSTSESDPHDRSDDTQTLTSDGQFHPSLPRARPMRVGHSVTLDGGIEGQVAEINDDSVVIDVTGGSDTEEFTVPRSWVPSAKVRSDEKAPEKHLDTDDRSDE